MKQLLVLICVAIFITSCSTGTAPTMDNGKDSVVSAYMAKDSVLEKNKATALASVQAFTSGKLDDAFKDVTPDAVDYGDGGMARRLLLALLLLKASFCFSQKKPPDKLVVLTFDDASQSHYSYVAPLLKKYGFGATFYVCECPPDFSDTVSSMSWYDIKQLSDMGFEIGNHTWHHARIDHLSNDSLKSELKYIERKCDSMKIPKPSSMAYPDYVTDATKIPVINRLGYTTARVGGNRAYNPVYDGDYYIPSFILHAHNEQEILDAFALAKNGHIVVLTVHGVPDLAHDALTTTPAVF